jgi:hypothetical protein
MPFARNPLPNRYVVNPRADFDDFAIKFVTRNNRGDKCFGGPVIPRLDVQISATDACSKNPNLDIVFTNLWFWSICKNEAWAGGWFK